MHAYLCVLGECVEDVDVEDVDVKKVDVEDVDVEDVDFEEAHRDAQAAARTCFASRWHGDCCAVAAACLNHAAADGSIRLILVGAAAARARTGATLSGGNRAWHDKAGAGGTA